MFITVYAGILLVTTSVIADAFLPNFQEKVFNIGSSRVEVTYFTNVLSLVLMTVIFTASGDLLVRIDFICIYDLTKFLLELYCFVLYP